MRFSKCVYGIFNTVDECYDSINFTTDGVLANKYLASKVKEVCIENSDIDEQWLQDFVINVCSHFKNIRQNCIILKCFVFLIIYHTDGMGYET